MARADEVIELENLLQCECRLLADCVAKVFLAFGRETLIQDRNTNEQ